MRLCALARRLCYVAAVPLACAGPALAEGPDDRYWIQLEGFWPSIESTARFDFPNLPIPGTNIRLEDDLGLAERKTMPYLLMGLRLGERWRLEFEYYELNRTATRRVQRNIRWGDLEFPVSAEVTSRFDSEIYRLSAGYSFIRSPTTEIGGALGLHVTDFALALSGRAQGPLGQASQSERADELLPLPTLGLYGTYMLSPQWMLRGRIDYLSLNYGKYHGSLLNLMAGVTWRFSKNFGAGIGYRYVDYGLEADKASYRGEVNYRFRGPTLYLEAVL